MRISYSALETFKRCPLKFKFQYLDRIKTPKRKEAIFGTLIHSALKILHEPGLMIPTEEEILKYIADNCDAAIYPSEQESAMAFAQAPHRENFLRGRGWLRVVFVAGGDLAVERFDHEPMEYRPLRLWRSERLVFP